MTKVMAEWLRDVWDRS